jgi:hypothetical protein
MAREIVVGREYADLLERKAEDLDLQGSNLHELSCRLRSLRGELANKLFNTANLGMEIEYISSNMMGHVFGVMDRKFSNSSVPPQLVGGCDIDGHHREGKRGPGSF